MKMPQIQIFDATKMPSESDLDLFPFVYDRRIYLLLGMAIAGYISDD